MTPYGLPSPSRRRDRGRIDYVALDPLLLQNTVQPEPVQPRLLDRDDRIALAGPDLCLAPEFRKQRQKLRHIAGRDAVLGHPLALAGRQRRHQPRRTAQFQRNKNCGNIRADSGRFVGRMIEQHRRLQVEWVSATSVWLQTWSLSTPHVIFASLAMTMRGAQQKSLPSLAT